MATKDDFSSFKIGDMRRPSVRTSNKSSDSSEPAPESASVGFPAVEARLEGGTVDSVAEELRGSYEKLEEMTASGDMRGKAGAKKAMGAYERAADLFEYLFQTKDALQGPGE